jgi:hypothetical protein
MTGHALATLSLVGFSGVFGGWVGRLVGHLLKRPFEHRLRMGDEGGFIAFGVALLCWIVHITINSL